MKKIFLLPSILFTVQVLAQEPYNFRKFKENNRTTDSYKKIPEKPQPLSKITGRITYSNPNGTFILPLDKNMSKDSLRAILQTFQKLREKQHMGALVHTMPNGTRVYALPQDNLPCLVPDMSQFNMPVAGKGIRITGMPPGSFPPHETIPKK